MAFSGDQAFFIFPSGVNIHPSSTPSRQTMTPHFSIVLDVSGRDSPNCITDPEASVGSTFLGRPLVSPAASNVGMREREIHPLSTFVCPASFRTLCLQINQVLQRFGNNDLHCQDG